MTLSSTLALSFNLLCKASSSLWFSLAVTAAVADAPEYQRHRVVDEITSHSHKVAIGLSRRRKAVTGL